MSDDAASFSTARVRLEEIVTQVRKKDTSLEKSLDLLEEGVRLANACTELIDRADWTVGGVGETAVDAEGSVAVTEGTDTGAAGAVVAASGESDDSGDSQTGSSDETQPAEEIVDGAPQDAELASDEDAFGEAADEAWPSDAPESRDDEA